MKKIWAKWKSIKKRWKFLLVAVVIIAFLIISGQIKQQQQQQQNREIVTVTRQDLTKEALRTGQVELQGVVEVTPPISGVISELMVTNGQEVAEGDVLFKVKTDADQAETAAAWAAYLSAKNTYEESQITGDGGAEWNEFDQAKMALMAIEDKIKSFEEANPEKVKHDDREYQQLKTQEAIAQRTLSQATLIPNRVANRQAQAKANYQAALAAYNATKDGTYRSPIAGRIENLGVNNGENVKAGIGDKEGTALFLIVPEGVKTISMQIGPNDAVTLQEGQMAQVASDLVKNSTFPAQIVRIDRVGTNQGDKGITYRAWLEVDDFANQLLLGTPVDITIQTAQVSQALVVPSEAVQDGLVTIVDEKGQEIERREVETGLKALGMTEVISGLNEGELVLIDHNLYGI